MQADLRTVRKFDILFKTMFYGTISRWSSRMPITTSPVVSSFMAGTPDAYPEPWAEGEKIWNIPVGWGFGGGEVVGRVSNPTTEKFTIHEDGRFRIEKYNHWAERNIYGLIWLDGNLVLWPW